MDKRPEFKICSVWLSDAFTQLQTAPVGIGMSVWLSFCLSFPLSARMEQLVSPEWIFIKYLFENFYKICRENSSFINI